MQDIIRILDTTVKNFIPLHFPFKASTILYSDILTDQEEFGSLAGQLMARKLFSFISIFNEKVYY